MSSSLKLGEAIHQPGRTVPTLTFSVLYCFFVISHDRLRILHCKKTKHPTSAWIVQQLREAFPFDSAPEYLIMDRGSNFNEEVIDTVKCFGTEPKRTSFGNPCRTALQNDGSAAAAGLEASSRSDMGGSITAVPRLGGLHHRYDLAA